MLKESSLMIGRAPDSVRLRIYHFVCVCGGGGEGENSDLSELSGGKYQI